ncbi:MAG: primosomal protein N' [Holosporales bacterium]|jgi:primosomal protein N' (replication factor Y)|nr:primosomal protein N' [Holosporales bacterium]
MNYSVAVPFDVPQISFTYSHIDDSLKNGQIVIVNFRNKECIGIITEKNNENYKGKLKQILSILPYRIPKAYIELSKFVSKYTITSFGRILKLLVPFSIESILLEEKKIKSVYAKIAEKISLNSSQAFAVSQIKKFDTQFKTILLHGVTGSGKTEVFLEIAKAKKQVLILIPEIALSTGLAEKITSRLPNIPVFIWHHSVSLAKKRDIWKKAINGEKLIIVGARSAVFIPFSKLELIIIDEEHDISLKQSEGIIYHARDMAIYLANLIKIPIILSSATPSFETYYNAIILKKYEYIELKNRYFKGVTPSQIYIDDLKKHKYNGNLLSEYSIKSIKSSLSCGKQALIFINRRGHTPRTLCSKCGWKATCPNCDTWLCYHEKDKFLRCHYCGYATKHILRCNECGGDTLIGAGIGIEKAFEQISKIFPNARIMNVSSDNMNTPAKIESSIGIIERGEVDIILGTQILAKGHNFMKLNTIIVSCVDSMLYGEDFRASEKAFAMILQVSGRAGRSEQSGISTVIFQTFNPDDTLVKLLVSGDLEEFYRQELSNRRATKMPPFGKIISITLSSQNQNELRSFANSILRNGVTSQSGIRVIGPITPHISRIRNTYRLRFIVISSHLVQNYVKNWINLIKVPKNIRITIDVDPYDFI